MLQLSVLVPIGEQAALIAEEVMTSQGGEPWVFTNTYYLRLVPMIRKQRRGECYLLKICEQRGSTEVKRMPRVL